MVLPPVVATLIANTEPFLASLTAAKGDMDEFADSVSAKAVMWDSFEYYDAETRPGDENEPGDAVRCEYRSL